MSDYRFKVNLSGMIEILSDHLYSSPDVYIRELLQNAVDAIVARKKNSSAADLAGYEGSIDVYLEDNTLRFIDNGIGLTDEEIHKFLSIIGESSKKQLNEAALRSDYIGKFGIGLLSCFMVSNEIIVKTRSIHSEDAFIWIGKPDGTYTLDKYGEPHDVGTEIILTPKEECVSYFEPERVKELLLHYGQILPYPIILHAEGESERINFSVLPWEKENVDKGELLEYGYDMFRTRFFDAVVLKSEAGDASGVAFILPYQVHSSAKQKHLVYLKNMLVTEKGDEILPDWAFFTRCIINSQNLRPTASREGFYNDEVLEKTRSELGRCITDYLVQMARDNHQLFESFMRIHELAIRSIACANDEMFDTFIDELYFHTTKGYLTGKELRTTSEDLVYADISEFKHLSQIFMAQNKLLIDAGYVYTIELLDKLSVKYDLPITRVSVDIIDDMLVDISPKDAETCVDFLTIAEEALKGYQVNVDMKKFVPSDMAAFYYIDDDVMLYQQVQNALNQSEDVFSGMLAEFASTVDEAYPTVFFNFNNPVIRNLINCKDRKLIEDIVTVQYIQTLLIGDFPLRNNELGTLNFKLLDLFDRCM